MSDEEIVLKRLKETLDVLKGKNVIGHIDFQIRDMVEDCIRVIEKQSKEIEELKEDNKKKSIVIIEYQDLYEKLQDKIKAKIEELEKLNDESTGIGYWFAIYYLQSLLEKE